MDLREHVHAVFGGIAVVRMPVWIVKKTSDKEMESAIRFLDDIKKFEKEEEESTLLK